MAKDEDKGATELIEVVCGNCGFVSHADLKADAKAIAADHVVTFPRCEGAKFTYQLVEALTRKPLGKKTSK